MLRSGGVRWLAITAACGGEGRISVDLTNPKQEKGFKFTIGPKEVLMSAGERPVKRKYFWYLIPIKYLFLWKSVLLGVHMKYRLDDLAIL